MATPTKIQSGMRVSVAEYLELELPEPDHKLNMELDDGVLYIMPRPRLRHQSAHVELIYYFRSHFRAFTEPPGEVYAEFVVALPAVLPRLFVPDISVVLRGSPAVVGDRMIEGAPDIVIEILSTDRNRDLVHKRRVYAEAGIPEYWIFDWLHDIARQLELRDGQYGERAVLTINDTLTTPLLPGLAIPLADVFRRPGPPAR